MAKRYLVRLSKDEREQLLVLLKRGKISARKLCRAQILLQADGGASDTAIATAVPVDVRTVERIRKRFVEEGLDAALNERRRPGGKPKLDGRQEAFLIALACSAAPHGRRRWTMQLLAERVVEIGLVPSISDDTVRRTLKKTPSNPG
jgi:transposase